MGVGEADLESVAEFLVDLVAPLHELVHIEVRGLRQADLIERVLLQVTALEEGDYQSGQRQVNLELDLRHPDLARVNITQLLRRLHLKGALLVRL